MTKRNIVHIEIPAVDVAKAGKFYQDLFGWKIETDSVMNYTMWEPLEGPGGGFSPLNESVKPGDVLIYVDSADIEADLSRIKALGGEIITPKTEIPKVGWFALFRDPTGNTLALYTSLNPDFNTEKA
ncbi:MAG: VOC family protein [Anaerolineales bacterium]|jgi:predicted enzyme related to lactoylglutathione lyase